MLVWLRKLSIRIRHGALVDLVLATQFCEAMAGMGRSASAGALVSAGAAMSHVPKRATQHACYLASWEMPRPTLKPGQVSASRAVYSEEAPAPKTTYLSDGLPPESMYQKTTSQLTSPEHYQNPVQPIRQQEPPASSVGHRGAAHWSSTYRTSHDDNSVAGAVYHRQHGPSYQAANPPTCIGGGGMMSAFMEDFGLYGSDPRSKVDPALDRIPVAKTALTMGTPKGTLHIPGYHGFLPTNIRNPYAARVESGATIRTSDKSNITQQFHVNTLHYAGHVPDNVTNEIGRVKPGNRSMMSRSFKVPDLRAFD